MKKIAYISLLLTLFLHNLALSNSVNKLVNPDKKKFSKTPVADTLKKSNFYVGTEFDYDRDGIPDKIEIEGISKYKYIKGNFTWTQARSDAKYLGGNLATITNEAENKKVQKATGTNKARIGGYDDSFEGRWNWVTGEPFKYENWAKNQPTKIDNSDDYLEIQKDGKWNDTIKITEQGYILETKIKTNPNLADSDGDGYTDLIEINANSDPRNRNSHPHSKKQ